MRRNDRHDQGERNDSDRSENQDHGRKRKGTGRGQPALEGEPAERLDEHGAGSTNAGIIVRDYVTMSSVLREMRSATVRS